MSNREYKPRLLKVCGIRQVHEAAYCNDLRIPFIGLNFVSTSKRQVDLSVAEKICKVATRPKKVGVFQNQKLSEVNGVAEHLDLDFIQLSGEESPEFVKGCIKPVIKGISLRGVDDLKMVETFDENVRFFLFDGPVPGSGEVFDWNLLADFAGDFFVAGGINEDNTQAVLTKTGARGVDVASGIETLGQIDLGKINVIWQEVIDWRP